jgi:CXXC-20-CXXC protein
MKHRTCPNCQYKYSLKEYYRIGLMKMFNPKWHCKNCNTLLTFHAGRRTFLIFIIIMPIAFSSAIIPFMMKYLHFTIIWSIILFAVLFFFWILLIFNFECFERAADKNQ